MLTNQSKLCTFRFVHRHYHLPKDRPFLLLCACKHVAKRVISKGLNIAIYVFEEQFHRLPVKAIELACERFDHADALVSACVCVCVYSIPRVTWSPIDSTYLDQSHSLIKRKVISHGLSMEELLSTWKKYTILLPFHRALHSLDTDHSADCSLDSQTSMRSTCVKCAQKVNSVICH